MAVLLFISDKQQNDLLRPMATDKALPREKGSDARIPLSPYRHFERKREIFFVCGQEETGEHRKMGNTVLHTLLAHGVSFAKETASGQRKALSAASMRRGFL